MAAKKTTSKKAPAKKTTRKRVSAEEKAIRAYLQGRGGQDLQDNILQQLDIQKGMTAAKLTSALSSMEKAGSIVIEPRKPGSSYMRVRLKE